MNHLQFRVRRGIALLGAAAFVALGLLLVFGSVVRAQDAGAQVTPSFGDGKLKILGAGFKANENVTITIKLDSGTSTFKATADAQGAFELNTGLDLSPGSSVQLDARGDQGSAGASITSVPILPLPQTGGDVGSVMPVFVLGLLLAVVGLIFVKRSTRPI